MRFLAFLEGMSGVRGFQVASLDGEILAESGNTSSEAWTAARTVGIAQDLAVAGALVGLGAFSGAAVRSPKSSRLLAQSMDGFALVDLDPAASTTEIENELRSADWLSKSETPEKGPDVEIVIEEPETLRPPVPHVPRRRVATPGPAGVPKLLATPTSAAHPEVKSLAAPVLAPPPRPAPRSPTPALGTGAQRTALPLMTKSGNAAPAQLASPQTADHASEVLPIARKVTASASGQMASVAAPVQSPQFTGSLRLFSLPDLLEFLRVGQRTGTLVCASEAGLGTISLRRGRIITAATAGVPSLGELLVQRGSLSPQQLEDAQRQQAQTRSPSLTATLQTGRFVSREVVHETTMHQVVHVVRRVMTWETGEFTFDPTTADVPSEYDVELDPQGVLLNVFKDMDDAQRA